MTLLEITQSILSAIDSDEVNSIDDTVESIQIADLVKESYFELLSQRDWPFLFAISNLEGLADTNNPTKMRMQEAWNKVKWIKYNKKEIEWLDPQTFNDVISNRVVQPNVIDANGYVINQDPQYWTSYDDQFIIFDGYDKTVDNTLQASKSSAYGTQQASWTHMDNFVPAIPEKFFPTLLAEAKSQAFVNLKQQANAREERKATRGRMAMRNDSWKNEQGEVKYNSRVNYGRS